MLSDIIYIALAFVLIFIFNVAISIPVIVDDILKASALVLLVRSVIGNSKHWKSPMFPLDVKFICLYTICDIRAAIRKIAECFEITVMSMYAVAMYSKLTEIIGSKRTWRAKISMHAVEAPCNLRIVIR